MKSYAVGAGRTGRWIAQFNNISLFIGLVLVLSILPNTSSAKDDCSTKETAGDAVKCLQEKIERIENQSSKTIFDRIEATKNVKEDRPASCKDGFKLLNWGVSQHSAITAPGWNYCGCKVENNILQAVYNPSDPNPNGVCKCFGLCAK